MWVNIEWIVRTGGAQTGCDRLTSLPQILSKSIRLFKLVVVNPSAMIILASGGIALRKGRG